LRREFSVSPIETGRVTPGTPAQMSTLGSFDPSSGRGGMPSIAPGTPGMPITRPSFLSSFLASLPSALAGGLMSNGDPRFPFGTGLPGALAGIAQNDQLRLQQRNQQMAEARQNALAAGTLANQASEAQLRQAQIDALQARPEEKAIAGSEFTDANGNRVMWFTGPNGTRQQVLGKATPPVPTAES